MSQAVKEKFPLSPADRKILVSLTDDDKDKSLGKICEALEKIAKNMCDARFKESQDDHGNQEVADHEVRQLLIGGTGLMVGGAVVGGIIGALVDDDEGSQTAAGAFVGAGIGWGLSVFGGAVVGCMASIRGACMYDYRVGKSKTPPLLEEQETSVLKSDEMREKAAPALRRLIRAELDEIFPLVLDKGNGSKVSNKDRERRDFSREIYYLIFLQSHIKEEFDAKDWSLCSRKISKFECESTIAEKGLNDRITQLQRSVDKLQQSAMFSAKCIANF